MTEAEIREILASLRQLHADHQHVEAKAARRGLPERLWQTMAAFANSPGGGVLLLGVDESAEFEVVGVEDPAKIQADLASLCDRMIPPLRPVIEVHWIDGRAVVTVEIAELPFTEKPCYYAPAGLVGGAYVRVADGDRRLTQYEVLALLERRHQPRHDDEPVEDARLDDLDQELLARFLNRVRSRRGRHWREMSDVEILRAFHVVTQHGPHLVPTLAGYLCFATYPQERFPNLCITFVRYPTDHPGEAGLGGERFLDNDKLVGPMATMVADALDVIKRNMRRRDVVRGLFREEVWEYPEAVLREALVNAVGHRDYSPLARGTPVQVQMYPSRLVVRNPGGLFGPVTVEDLGRPGVQASRNQFLMNILEELPAGTNGEALCEHRGSGIAAMLATLRRAGMQPPIFEDKLISFEVTFSNASLLDPETLQWLERRTGSLPLTDSQRLALAYLRHRSYIANQEYCRLTGVDSRVATRELADLVERGLVTRQGTRRWATYALAAEEPSQARPEPETVPLPFRPTRTGPAAASVAERVSEVLRRQGEASARELAAATGASASSVRSALRHLIQKGLVQPTPGAPRSPLRRYRWVGPR